MSSSPAQSSSQQGAGVPTPSQLLLQLSTGYMPSACLYAAAQLKIADAISESPKSTVDLARLAGGVNEGALYRALRALAGVGVFTEVAPRTFANTPASDLLRQGVPGSVRDIVLWLTNPLHLRVFGEFDHSIATGGTAIKKLTGHEAFEYFGQDAPTAAVFHAAMTNFSSLFLEPVVTAYDFGSLGTLADIGGGHGYLLTAILQKHPGLRGIVFDLPDVVKGAQPRIDSLGLGSRCEAAGGSFFERVPAADTYMMKSIIHDWTDDKAVEILRNCAASMRSPAGKVLLIELMVNAGNEGDMAKWIDLEMLTMAGGKERTEAEFAALFTKAGLRLERVVRTQSPYCVIEAVKA